jgi:hypothetical protein
MKRFLILTREIGSCRDIPLLEVGRKPKAIAAVLRRRTFGRPLCHVYASVTIVDRGVGTSPKPNRPTNRRNPHG